MEHEHPNVTQRKGDRLSEKLSGVSSPWKANVSGEENDNPPAETTALPNTSEPLVLSQAQLEALTNSIGQMMSFQVNNTLSAFESKFMAEIEQVKLGRSRSSSSEEPSLTSHDDDDAPPGDSREVGEGKDNNDEEDPRSVGGSESSPSNEQGASNTQQHPSGGGNSGDPSDDEDAASNKKKKKKKKKRQSLFQNSAGKDDPLVYHIQAGVDSLHGRKRRNPPGKDLKELGSKIYADSSSEQPITEELFQKVYDLVMEHVERPIALSELESTSDLFFYNNGVTLNEEYSLNILNKDSQPLGYVCLSIHDVIVF